VRADVDKRAARRVFELHRRGCDGAARRTIRSPAGLQKNLRICQTSAAPAAEDGRGAGDASASWRRSAHRGRSCRRLRRSSCLTRGASALSRNNMLPLPCTLAPYVRAATSS